MDDCTDLPDHLSYGPTIEDADFIFDGFSPSEISAIHTAITNLTAEFSSLADPHTTRYFILGNYDDRPNRRFYAAKRILQDSNQQSVALLLDDLDPANDNWENFYLKFRYTLTLIDYPVLIAEDNDGGHELELGELPLRETYVTKRDYEDFSIDHDLEYEKYDAMIAKLFELLDRNDRLFVWTDRDSFEHAVRAIAEQTREEIASGLDPEAFAWTPVLCLDSGRGHILPTHVQRPAIQAHIYGCASIVCILLTTEMLQTDILRGVVIRVVLVPALLTLERLLITIIVMGKPALRATLRCVPRVNFHDFDAVFFGFVFDVFVEASERPDVLSRRLGDVLPNVSQILEHDVRTAVLNGLLDNVVAPSIPRNVRRECCVISHQSIIVKLPPSYN